MTMQTMNTYNKSSSGNKAKLILEDISREIGNPKLIDKIIIAQDVKDGYPKPCNTWSMHNRLLMVYQGTADARGKNQWVKFTDKKTKKIVNVDRKPMAIVQKPIYIFIPSFVDMCKKCNVQLFDGQCQQCKITKKDNPSDVTSKLDFTKPFLSIPLVAVEETTGKKLPEFKPKKRPELEYVAQKLGCKVVYNELIGALGYYHRVTKEIHLATTDQTVFFHELGHAIDHKLHKDFIKMPKAKREAVAELTSCVIARMYGIDMLAHSQNYLSRYTKGKAYVANLTMGVLNKVGNVLDFIFEAEKPKSKKKGVKK